MQIKNIQSLKKINRRNFSSIAAYILKYLKESSREISLVLCDNAFIQELNYKYFGKKTVTDVIAFPLSDSLTPDYLGEVVISVEQAIAYSSAHALPLEDEVLLYLIHGILHLVGYRDDTKRNRQIMAAKQDEVIDFINKRKNPFFV